MRSLLLAASAIQLALAAGVPQNYVNTAVARTVELGAPVTQVTTQYNVKALVDGPGAYHLALGPEDGNAPAWWEVSIDGKPVEGAEHYGLVLLMNTSACAGADH